MSANYVTTHAIRRGLHAAIVTVRENSPLSPLLRQTADFLVRALVDVLDHVDALDERLAAVEALTSPAQAKPGYSGGMTDTQKKPLAIKVTFPLGDHGEVGEREHLATLANIENGVLHLHRGGTEKKPGGLVALYPAGRWHSAVIVENDTTKAIESAVAAEVGDAVAKARQEVFDALMRETFDSSIESDIRLLFSREGWL